MEDENQQDSAQQTLEIVVLQQVEDVVPQQEYAMSENQEMEDVVQQPEDHVSLFVTTNKYFF